MAQYDPEIIRSAAHQLYARAGRIVVAYSLVGGLVGGMAGGVAAAALNARDGRTTVLALVTAIGALLGLVLGREKAFSLRLQAQTALCHLQIETNTRTRETIGNAQ